MAKKKASKAADAGEEKKLTGNWHEDRDQIDPAKYRVAPKNTYHTPSVRVVGAPKEEKPAKPAKVKKAKKK